jgi:uncharacterized membrane protein
MNIKETEKDIHKVMASLKVKNANEQNNNEQLSIGDKISEKLTIFAGTWKNVLSIGGFICLWIIANTFFVKIDVFPYILLNLCISILCVLQAPIIMMGQNLINRKEKIKSDIDYETSLKNQMYLEHIHDMLEKQQEQITRLEEKLNK